MLGRNSSKSKKHTKHCLIKAKEMPMTSKWVLEMLVISNSTEVWPKHGLEKLPIVMTSMKTSRSFKNDAGPKESLKNKIWEMRVNSKTISAQKMKGEDESFGNKLKKKVPVIDLALTRTKKIRKHIRRPKENMNKKYLQNSMISSNLATHMTTMLQEMIPVEQITKPTLISVS